MHVRVRFFASLRQIVGSPVQTLELPEGATVEQAWNALAQEYPGLGPRRAHVAASVDRRYAPFEAVLAPGAEIVFIPPVSGG